MKSTDIIRLNSTRQVTVQGGPNDGEMVSAPETRTVAAEIERLRHAGMHEAAERLECSCDDRVLNTGKYVEVDPTATTEGKRKFDHSALLAEALGEKVK